MRGSRIEYSWRTRDAGRGFRAGVSLHGHTCMSQESLAYVAQMGTKYGLLRPIFENRQRYCRESHGIELNYAASYWTPPLTPRMAFDLEREQIEERLQLPGMVSLTDHDDVRAPLALRAGGVGCRCRRSGRCRLKIRCFIDRKSVV